MPSVKKPRRHLQPHFLRQWREYRNMTQERAAPLLDISRTQLSKIEGSKIGYSQGILEAAAHAYGCSVADLLIRNPLDTDAPWTLLDTLKKATPEQRRQAVAIVETLLKTGT